MADTLREKILQAFTAKVNAGRCLGVDGDGDLPARSVWDTAENAERTSYGTVRCIIDLPVEYIAKVSKDYLHNSAQANAMLGELIQDATAGDNTLGSLCCGVSYSSSEIVYPEDGAQEIVALAVFQIIYEFALGNPFQAA